MEGFAVYMNYDLAKKLKDAGFPQGIGCHMYGEFINQDGIGDEFSNERNAYPPTLSELIEACGDGFGFLARGDEKVIQERVPWVCAKAFLDWNTRCTGKTPEEAVANLWLKLNKKI